MSFRFLLEPRSEDDTELFSFCVLPLSQELESLSVFNYLWSLLKHVHKIYLIYTGALF
jgi:hypothetical protein